MNPTPVLLATDGPEPCGAGLILMGSRGWGEMHAALMGSASERVQHTAYCPVLIARPIKMQTT